MGAEVIQVIRSTDLRLGDGTPEHPIREVVRYYSLDGALLLWEFDPLRDDHPRQPEPAPSRGD